MQIKNSRAEALRLLRFCDDVFNRYAPDDDFYSDPASRQLAGELTERIRENFEINGLQ